MSESRSLKDRMKDDLRKVPFSITATIPCHQCFPSAQIQDTRMFTCVIYFFFFFFGCVSFDRIRPCRQDYWNQFHAFFFLFFPLSLSRPLCPSCTHWTVVCVSVCLNMEGMWSSSVHRLETTSPELLKMISTRYSSPTHSFILTLNYFLFISGR